MPTPILQQFSKNNPLVKNVLLQPDCSAQKTSICLFAPLTFVPFIYPHPDRVVGQMEGRTVVVLNRPTSEAPLTGASQKWCLQSLELRPDHNDALIPYTSQGIAHIHMHTTYSLFVSPSLLLLQSYSSLHLVIIRGSSLISVPDLASVCLQLSALAVH